MASLRIARVLLCVGLSLCLVGRRASAQQPQVQQTTVLERSIIAEALQAKGWTLEPHPEGKTIEEVGVYVLDVFDRRDPVPQFVNIFHAKSRDWVIKQEVLLHEGDRWEPGRILETERNLRKLRQVSLANVVAAQGKDPDHVRLLVVVKDVWSLRLNSAPAIGQDVDSFFVNPAEENFGGIHLTVGLLYLLERDRHSFGVRFVYPRLASSRYWLAAESSFSTNRDSGEVEGSSGTFVFQLPLYSRLRHFAYGADAAWNLSIARRYRGSGYLMYQYQDPAGSVERIPQTFHVEALAAEYWFLHSLGVTNKRDFSYGIELNHRRYSPEDLSQYSDDAQAAFERDVLPVSDRRLGPYAQLRLYQTKFHRTPNVELLGVEEDLRAGYDVQLRMYAAAQVLGSSRDLVGSLAGLGVTLPFGDGLVRAQVSNDLVLANEAQNEALLSLAGRVAFPSLAPGRLHLDVRLATRYQNYLNVGPFGLGSNNRLRGYGFNEVQGRDVLAMSAEFRTKPVDILSAQVGLAAFVDIADAAPSLTELSMLVGTGIGLRILFPQLGREVLRLDWGLPVSRPADIFPGAVYFTFGQAFSIPSLSTPSVTAPLSPF